MDPGSLVAGFACVELPAPSQGTGPLEGLHLLDLGVLKADPKGSALERLGQLHQALHAILVESGAQHCAMEGGYLGKNPHSALQLGQTRGALLAAASRCGIPTAEISPSWIKKSITGRGDASKEAVALSLGQLLGRDFRKLPQDATDALATALCFAIHGASAPGKRSRSWPH